MEFRQNLDKLERFVRELRKQFKKGFRQDQSEFRQNLDTVYRIQRQFRPHLDNLNIIQMEFGQYFDII